jgi:hypothetical protein
VMPTTTAEKIELCTNAKLATTIRFTSSPMMTTMLTLW